MAPSVNAFIRERMAAALTPPPFVSTGFPPLPPMPPCVVPPPLDAPVPAEVVKLRTAANAAEVQPAPSEKAYVLELKMVHIIGGKEEEMTCPKLTFLEGKTAVVHVGKCLALKQGSVDDLVQQANYVSPQDEVQLGNLVRVKVMGLDKKRVQVDLTVRHSEVEKASKRGIVVVGNSVRSVCKVHLGKVGKLVLDRNDQGAARTRIEFKVTAEPK
jgi:hypothetical protein